jgi:hypothetical protein
MPLHLGLRVKAGVLEQFASSEKNAIITMLQVVAHLADLRHALQVAADSNVLTISAPTQDAWEPPVLYSFKRK